MPLRLPALSPVAWVTAEKVTQQALWLVLFTVLAPILGPGPYGVFSIVMVFVGFCEFVLGDGAIEALLTVDELTPQYMASANLATLLLSLAVSLILFLLAPAIAVGFHAEPTPGDDGVQESHAAVSRTARTLRVGKLEAGVAKAIGQGLCGIEVGTDSVERVTAILDRLAHGLESRGLLLEPTGTGMKVAIAPDHVFFTLTERIETRKHVPTV